MTQAPPGLGRLSGFVKLASGSPIPGASVAVSPGGYGNDTIGDGSYTVEVPPGTYSVSASAPLHNVSTRTGVTVTAAATKWINFTLAFTAGWIAGTVTRAAGGTPLAAVGITVLTGSGTSVAATSTNSQGKYNLSVADGTYTVKATSSAYSIQSKTGITVNGGQTTTVDFQLVELPSNAGGLSALQLAGIAIVVVIAAVAILAVLLMRRKRKKEAEEAKINLPPR